MRSICGVSRRLTGHLIAYAWLLSQSTLGYAQFTNVTSAAGVAVVHNQQGTTMLDTMSGGAAAGDYDRDGWVDLYVSRIDGPDRLYRNNGDGTFSDVFATAFPQLDIDPRTNGPTWGDIDNDGDLDLYLTSWGGTQNYLFINHEGIFQEQAIPRQAAVDAGTYRTAASATFGDYDADGYLDLYTTEWYFQGTPQSHTRLLRNRGAAAPGHFEDVTAHAGVGTGTFSRTFAGRFTDLDRDGHMDLAVAADFGQSKLYWNRGDGTFLDGTDASGANEDDSAMGSALGDYDRDGDLDWFLGNIDVDGNNLYQNQQRQGSPRSFVDHALTAGVEDSDWSWGSSFLDLENDGDLDLMVTNGVPTSEGTDYSVDPIYLFANQWAESGTAHFADAADAYFAGGRDRGMGSGLVVFDYDRDGDQDVFVVNGGAGEASILYRNDTPSSGNFLQLSLTGSVSNRDGLGAWIEVTPDLSQPDDVLVWEVNGGSNFLGQNESLAHFGLADTASVDQILIHWPSGQQQRLTDVGANQRLSITEPIPEPSGIGMLITLGILGVGGQRRRARRALS